MPESPTTLPAGHAVVVTMDQRHSRRGPDRVDGAIGDLNERYADVLARPFVRTAGDEIQGVAESVDWVVDLVLAGARDEHWWIGIGIGAVEPLGPTARESRGDAFYRARTAVDVAKRRPWGFAIAASPAFEPAQQCLLLLAFLVRHRTARQHAAAELFRRHDSVRAVARELGLSPSTVSQSLRRAGAVEEIAGRELARDLLAEAARHG